MIYVEFEHTNGTKLAINPYCVEAIYQDVGSVRIVLTNQLTYPVKGTFEEVLDALRGCTK